MHVRTGRYGYGVLECRLVQDDRLTGSILVYTWVLIYRIERDGGENGILVYRLEQVSRETEY